jgi:hypothetical protein
MSDVEAESHNDCNLHGTLWLCGRSGWQLKQVHGRPLDAPAYQVENKTKLNLTGK